MAAIFLLPARISAQSAPPPQSPPPGVVSVNGHLTEEYAVPPDGKIRFWISIENRTGTEITNVHLVEVYAPGFVLQGRCKAESGQPITQTTENRCCVDQSGDDKSLCAGVPAGGSRSGSFDLLATKPESEYDFYVTVAWTSGSTAFSTNVPLGKGRAVGRGNRFLLELPSQPLLAAVPLVVALLAALFAWETKRLEQRAMTWTSTILVEAHKAAVKYYMPMATWYVAAAFNIKAYREEVVKCQKAQPPCSPLVPQKAYFYMMMGQWFYWQTLVNETAFHLKNLTGEDVVQQLYGRHNELFGLADPEFKRLIDRILGTLKKNTSLNDFLVATELAQSDASKGWIRFCQWAHSDECEKDIEVLICFASVLEYEINRPNISWYGSLDPLRIEPEHVELIYSLKKEDTAWPGTIDEYLARARVVTRQGFLSLLQKTRYWAGKPWRAYKRWERSLNA
jgi:hypothetical protein